MAVTSYLRRRLCHVAWKKVHYTASGVGILMFVHGTLIDQNLKNQAPDFLDGEKVLIKVCFLIVVAATIWRWRYGSEKRNYLAAVAPERS